MTPDEVFARFEEIGRDVTAVHAPEADRDARFPHETIAALRAAGLLSLFVPEDLGGPGGTVVDVARAIGILGGHDGSVGLILTMHYSQIEMLARHGRSAELQDFLREVHERQLLLANSNSEIAIRGNERSSSCAVEELGDGRFRLAKDTPVISYGEHADAFLVTARRSPDSAPGEQVIAVCRREDVDLQPTGPWDALGLRASCSRPFHLEATGSTAMVVPDYVTVVNETGLPVTNLLFGGYWLGMAEAAAATAHSFARKRYRTKVEEAAVPLLRLAELSASLDQLRGLVVAANVRYERIAGTAEVQSLSFVTQLQTLKVAGSRLLAEIVGQALQVCGIAGYRNDSPASLGRALRDAIGAGLMVNNDSVLGQNGQLLMIRKEI